MNKKKYLVTEYGYCEKEKRMDTMYEEQDAYKVKTQKLGDEWENWDGSLDDKNVNTEASPSLFLSLLTVSTVIEIITIWSVFALLSPKLTDISVKVGDFFGLISYTVILIIIIFYLLFCLTIIYKKPFTFFLKDKHLPNLSITKIPLFLGKKIGISHDKILNSIIKTNNIMTKVLYNNINKEDLLILVPRCLSKNTREELKKITSQYNITFHIAAGGSQARKILKEHRPKGIVAVACERDLYAGVKDVPSTIPVLGIANSRPEGPCTNTIINIKELESAIQFFLNSKTS